MHWLKERNKLSTKHYTENERFNNTSTTKTEDGLRCSRRVEVSALLVAD